MTNWENYHEAQRRHFIRKMNAEKVKDVVGAAVVFSVMCVVLFWMWMCGGR